MSKRQVGECVAVGCGAVRLIARNMCQRHYSRWRRGVPDLDLLHVPARDAPACEVTICERRSNSMSGGLCESHLQRLDSPRGLDPSRPIVIKGNGRYVDSDGYVVLTGMHAHPQATKNGAMFEHQRVMSDHLGRRLFPGETVHHLNGIRDDNRYENLELWASMHPRGQRVTDLLAWAYEVIDRYDDKEIAA